MRRAFLVTTTAAAFVGIGAATVTVAAGADELPDIGPNVLETGKQTTFGLGFGALYGGLGVNFGRIDGTRLTYGSLGCIGAAGGSTGGTNCGIGAGILSTAFLPGEHHGLGLNLGLTYDAINDTVEGDELQWHVRPTYNYFFNGLGSGGVNLGFAPVLTFDGDGDTEGSLQLNLGYQF